MTSVRALEAPLRAWRSFRDIARATRTLAAAQALHWSELARHADAHLAWCETVLASSTRRPPAELSLARTPAPRVVLALGSDLGLCGPLNQRVADRCVEAKLGEAPTVLRIVVGARLAALAPLPGAIELSTPSSLPAARLLAAQIETHIEALPVASIDLSVVLADEVAGDGAAQVALRADGPSPGLAWPSSNVEASDEDRVWFGRPRPLLGDELGFTREAERLARHARVVAALCRALTSENEARLRTMSRAHESALRRIGVQERRVRKLRQELITQEMLEARQGSPARSGSG